MTSHKNCFLELFLSSTENVDVSIVAFVVAVVDDDYVGAENQCHHKKTSMTSQIFELCNFFSFFC